MGRVVLDMSMSLDGGVAGPDGRPPDRLHDWYFAPSPTSRAVIDELVAMIGVRLAVPPLLVPGGVRLFPDVNGLRLESVGAVWTPEATHMTYRVVR